MKNTAAHNNYNIDDDHNKMVHLIHFYCCKLVIIIHYTVYTRNTFVQVVIHVVLDSVCDRTCKLTSLFQM